MTDISFHHTVAREPLSLRLIAVAAALVAGLILAEYVDLSVLNTGVEVQSNDWHGNVMRSHN